MALLAEELVEEWLRRQGLFTIRGARVKVHEIDLLAIGVHDGQITRRHVEVQASPRPMKYLTKLAKDVQRSTGRGALSAAKRDDATLEQSVLEWVETKFDNTDKLELMQKLAPGKWTRELVVYNVKHPREIELIASHDVRVWKLEEIVQSMTDSKAKPVLKLAAGSDLLDLIALGKPGS
jgi:hypothetical protein